MWNVRNFFFPEDIAVMKEYEIITLKYDGKACRLYLLYLGAFKDIILYAIRPGSTKFEGKCLITILAGLAFVLFFQCIWPNLMIKWAKWNEITRQIWLWMYQEQYVNFPGKQGLAINLPWPALKSKQCIELFDIISWQPGGGEFILLLCLQYTCTQTQYSVTNY